MKKMFAVLMAVLTLGSCVFEEPFESGAKLPVDEALLGSWEEIPKDPEAAANRLLVLRHSENEYLAEYPVGAEAMYFRAFAVEMAGEHCIQIQLIGTADGPVKPGERKYHLLKVAADGGVLDLRTIDPGILGKNVQRTEELRESFAVHAKEPGLFGEAQRFRRVIIDNVR